MSAQPESVIVVGGGIIGASIAWHLAKETKVTIIAEEIGGEATPRSFSWINAANPSPKYYYEFRRRSMQRWVEIGKELPDLPISWSGVLSWDQEPEALAEHQKRHLALGTEIARMDSKEIAALESEIKDEFLPKWGWALHVPEEGTVEAHIAAALLIAHAEKLGAKVIKTHATGFLKQKDGRVSGVNTTSGEVYGDHVVLAAGLGSVPLLAAENIRLPLNGRKGVLANTTPVDKQYLKSVVLTPGLHMRQTLDGRIRFGPDFAGGDINDDPEVMAKKLFERLQKVFKTGDELEFGYYTIGVRPDPEDGFPIIGATGLDGLDVAVMHSGVTNAALVGELVAKRVLHNVNDPMLAPFRLDRFKTNLSKL